VIFATFRGNCFWRGAKTLEKLFCREQSQNSEAELATNIMLKKY
jgi:hypothetical protein